METFLRLEERAILEEAHRASRQKREADRIKAVLSYDDGFSVEQIARVLRMDESSVYRHIQRYQEEGLDRFLEEQYTGGECRLTDEQLQALDAHLEGQTYRDSKEIAAHIQAMYGTTYSHSGMVELLHRLDYVYKKSKQVPSQADPEKQRAWLKGVYAKIKAARGPDDRIYFLDATHPVHNSMPCYGWVKKGKDKEILSNSGRQRVNLYGAVDVERMDVAYREEETINGKATVELLYKLEMKNPRAKVIYAILDNARYHHSKEVRKYVKHSRIRLIYLPSYSPNLNLIERLWQFLHEEVLYNQYYAKFIEFKAACLSFLAGIKQHKKALKKRLRENFRITCLPQAGRQSRPRITNAAFGAAKILSLFQSGLHTPQGR